MKGVILQNNNSGNIKSTGSDYLLRFFIIPVRSGLYGFAAFFTILIFAKAFWFMLGYLDLFSVTTDDVILSFIGFAIIFIVRFLQNFKMVQH